MFTNFLKDYKQGFIDFGLNINAIVNAIGLSLIYFLGIGFTWIMVKFMNIKLLDLQFKSKKNSYWKDINLTIEPIEKYLRQF